MPIKPVRLDAPRIRRRSGGSRLAHPRPLSFDDDRRPPPRAGDELAPDEYRDAFPPARGRHAGVTSVDEIGYDDLSPETLIDEDGSRPFDKVLRHVDEADIGAGGELDEADDDELDPVSDRLARAKGLS